MSKPVVLITSATSRNGRAAAELLLASSTHTVRLAARDPSKLSDLISKGAEPLHLDPSSPSSMTAAFYNVSYLYLILPTVVGDHETKIFTTALHAAKQTDVKHIVYLSAIDAAPADNKLYTPIHHHYHHEELLSQSNIPHTILRPAWFHENQVRYHADSIKRYGEMKTSAGDGLWTSIAIQDIAAVAVTVLRDPSPHAGKIYTLATEAVTDPLVAETISRVTGRKVKYERLSPEEHYEWVVQLLRGTEEAKRLAAALVALDKEKRLGLFGKVDPDLEVLLGRKGLPLEEFLAQHREGYFP